MEGLFSLMFHHNGQRKQIKPVLSNRDEDSFAFRVVTNDDYTKLRVSKGTDIFGEEENVKEYDIMKW